MCATAALLVSAGTTLAASGVVTSKGIEIKGKTAADVLAKFGAFCAIKDWHPAVAKCDESKEGNDTFRTLTLKDGGVIKEKLTSKGDEGYSYKIVESPLPVKDYMATFSIKKDGDGDNAVRINWLASYQAKGKTEAEAKAVIEGIFDAGLKSLSELAAK
ncbi:MAG: SRPBCC family protein [Hyphomicrobium sp.]|nr:SRPBCC family protein [Hyphomicrobium sp.]